MKYHTAKKGANPHSYWLRLIRSWDGVSHRPQFYGIHKSKARCLGSICGPTVNPLLNTPSWSSNPPVTLVLCENRAGTGIGFRAMG
ncbi:hypothetical protein L873DRAFT_1804459 [Choiromyces venosus 120613-1]|uniref:Uncharacterized protein n=1 Tax=Choiromyces venosus 120613-1 TaxID=1336337 RepID=A0A3N4K4B3_9PEZI|nr:hypothetical protein L873DRAFT_1804459 [Choiromyces venosus 120613-1]